MELPIHSKLNIHDFFDLLSECTDDCLFVWDIQKGTFDISKNAFTNFQIEPDTRTDILSVWTSAIVEADVDLWLNDLKKVQKGEKDYHDMEYRIYNKNGEVIWVSCRGKLKLDENKQPQFMVGRISNIGKQNKFDNITGLMNRQQCELNLKTSIEKIDGAVIVFDIDNFKNINEQYGYSFGDHFLNMFSSKIMSLLPENCSMYRLNGDTFAILIENGTRQVIESIYYEIQLYFKKRLVMDGHRLFITLSAGACFFPTDGHIAHELLRHAENAVEIAKLNGKNQLIFFSEEMYQKGLQLIELQESLHNCVVNGFQEFELYYQPQIDTQTQKVVGAEALLRWHSPKHGEVSPVEFIPLLEESHLIIQVGKWILDQAMEQCQKWQKYNPDFMMSINVSYVQLKENALLEYLRVDMKERGMPIKNCILELTENCWVPDLKFVNEEFQNIRKMGYGIAIDDFGTGYSSLNYLKELPANIIKIDRGFITGITEESYEYIFLEYIVKLAHVINLCVCVEGVETQSEFNVVKKAKPDYIQGFLFGKPISASIFERSFLMEEENI